MLSISAIIAARNELVYLKILVPYLISENINVILIDNDSTDGTVDYIKQNFTDVRIELLPFKGVFDLTEQLQVKSQISQTLNAKWVIHHDADEIMHDCSGWSGLRSSIEEADKLGCNALNFQELVMLPCQIDVDDILNNNRNFYYFRPEQCRKMTTYKLGSGIDNIAGAGHKLTDVIKLYDRPMFLRHYIVRSQHHAVSKFSSRDFSKIDLSKNWHHNRCNLSENKLRIPIKHKYLQIFPEPFDVQKVLSCPVSTHYWEW